MTKFLRNHLGFLLMLLPFFVYLWLPHFKGLNSDLVIPALMTEDYRFVRDWYYWGQDRLGSFPVLVALPFNWLGLCGLYATAISQVLLLAGTCALLQRYFAHPLLKASPRFFYCLFTLSTSRC